MPSFRGADLDGVADRSMDAAAAVCSRETREAGSLPTMKLRPEK